MNYPLFLLPFLDLRTTDSKFMSPNALLTL